MRTVNHRPGPVQPASGVQLSQQPLIKPRRQAFGGTLLLALEILVAADLIRTIAVSPTLDNVLILGLIVLIRTFLSFSLEIEIEGVWPWRRAQASGAGAVMQATRTALEPGTSPPTNTRPPGSP